MRKVLVGEEWANAASLVACAYQQDAFDNPERAIARAQMLEREWPELYGAIHALVDASFPEPAR